MTLRKNHFDTLANECKEIIKHKSPDEPKTIDWLVKPFLELLGYPPEKHLLVEREYSVNPKDKKSEKVDFAILNQNTGKPLFFVECKALHTKLSECQRQIARYFSQSRGSDIHIYFHLLTDGSEWQFYTDLQKPNILDKEPFHSLDVKNIQNVDIQLLKHFHKDNFSPENINKFADERTNREKVLRFVEENILSPSQGFINYVAKTIFGTNDDKCEFVKKNFPVLKIRSQTPTNGNDGQKCRKIDNNLIKSNLSVFNHTEIIEYTYNNKCEKPNGRKYITWVDMYKKVVEYLLKEEKDDKKRISFGKKLDIFPYAERKPNGNYKPILDNCELYTNLTAENKVKRLIIALEHHEWKFSLEICTDKKRRK